MQRRTFLEWTRHGLGATALATLLSEDRSLASGNASVASGSQVRPQQRVKRAIQICLVGGMSHVDTFDYKPALSKLHGRAVRSEKKPEVFFDSIGLLRKSDWTFRKRCRSGLWISDLFPHLARMADDLTVIRSMHSDSASHTPALFLSNSGFASNGFPSLGSWLSYGLGNEADSLPTYVVLPDNQGTPNGGASNWSTGFLPARHQGVVLNSGSQTVPDLFPGESIPKEADAFTRRLIDLINQQQLADNPEDKQLHARIRSYELAAKMQTSIPEVGSLSQEPAYIRELYGLDDDTTSDGARRCLLARRLLERGVRFIQIFSGGPLQGKPRTSWDGHESTIRNHTNQAKRIDRPVAGLLQDLKQRGLLEDTLVLFTTEFGRTPFSQGSQDRVSPGRDHNPKGFSVWMAGGGLQPGIAYGETDEIGWKAAQNKVSWHDFHATVLHLFGIDHEKMAFYHNGIKRRLTNVHGQIVRKILA